ncbi:MAG TPA: LUD domain-containing protein [Solirubrobacterales bacterium]|nr:LUD domain-containing protein [Solirubrobacterales bacterium]
MSDRELILGRVRAALADVPAAELVAFDRGQAGPDATYPRALAEIAAAEPVAFDRDDAEPAATYPRALADATAVEPAAFDRDDAEPAATYLRTGDLDAAARLALFVERSFDYQATVTVCADDPGSIAKAIAAACARHDARRLVVPEGLDRGWLPSGIEAVVDDPPLGRHELAGLDGVVTGCELGIAVTGTVALATGPAQGRRAVTLLPDLHVCVVRGEQIVETVPEAIARLAGPLADRRPITFISGPSATSDIELKRVEGVHGPRRLELIVTDPAL